MADSNKFNPHDLMDAQLLRSFIDRYSPWEDFGTADEILTDLQLRDEFNAWVSFGNPDLLPHYKEELYNEGFTTRRDPSTGSPCILVRYKRPHPNDINI